MQRQMTGKSESFVKRLLPGRRNAKASERVSQRQKGSCDAVTGEDRRECAG